jgi:hypothetical protein
MVLLHLVKLLLVIDAGAIVQVTNVQTGAVATGTTSIPNDDTMTSKH